MEQPRIMQVAHKGSGGQKGYIHCTEGIVEPVPPQTTKTLNIF